MTAARCKRRNFILRLTNLSIGGMLLGACTGKGGDHSLKNRNDAGTDPEQGLQANREMPWDLLCRLLDQKVDHYMQISNNCAQSSYLALSEQFGITEESVLKALTPLPGLAERGETCGAVTGPLMVIGQVYGRGRINLHDWDAYRKSLVPAGHFCKRFEWEFGSSMCHDIQETRFGRSFQLSDPEDLKAFQQADATGKCSEVVRKAVRMAAEILLHGGEGADDI